MKFAEAYVELLVKNDKLKRDMDKGNTIAKSGFAGIANAAKAAGAAIAGYLGARMLFRGLQSIVGAAAEADNIMGSLEQVLIATGYSAGFTARELDKYAGQLQKVTKYSDETIKELMIILATFRDVKGDQFKQATELILDMGQTMGRDAKGGALQLGRALNDPILGVSALNEAGVNFSITQRKMIKGLVENGKIMEAQNMILAEMRHQFGGLAKAAGERLGGKIDRLKNEFQDLKVKMGEAFITGSQLPQMMKDVGTAAETDTSMLVDLMGGLGMIFRFAVGQIKVAIGTLKVLGGLAVGTVAMLQKIATFGRSGQGTHGIAKSMFQEGIGSMRQGLGLDSGKPTEEEKSERHNMVMNMRGKGISPARAMEIADKRMAAQAADRLAKQKANADRLSGFLPQAGDGDTAPADALKSSIATVRSSALGAGLGGGMSGGFSLAPISLPSGDGKPASEDTLQELLIAAQATAANTAKPNTSKFGK